MSPWLRDLLEIVLALFLVALNGFFVAAEFALVKVRPSQLDDLIRQRRTFARTAKWLAERLEGSLSACQLGITMASLALGWVGEPAFAHLLEPVFHGIGIENQVLLHTLAFVIAFTAITALHLVIGEQAPKIFAIKRADHMALWCAPLLKFFYLLTYPLMMALNAATSFILRRVGLESDSEHDSPHTEDEIRALLSEAHLRGSLTRSEHRLINAVFEFDDLVCRRVMVPRNEVEYFDTDETVQECIAKARRTKHTRYPVCDGSLDEVLGVVHIKDLVGMELDDNFDWRSIMRPPRKVPESMPISMLLRHFQATHQLLAFVIDEYGTVIGIVTLENVLEQIIGEVEDEFDIEQPNIVPDGPGQWIILGSTPVEDVQRKFDLQLPEVDVDTFSGLLMDYSHSILDAGDEIDMDPYLAEVLEVRDDRAVRVRFRRKGDHEQDGTPLTGADSGGDNHDHSE